MMRKFALLLFLCGIALLGASQQVTLSVLSDDDEGISQKLSSYLSFDLGNWQVDNITFAKFSQEQDGLAEYYQRNYLRNKLVLRRDLQAGYLRLFGSAEFAPADNVPSHLAGMPGTYQLDSGLGLGADVRYRLGVVELDATLNYNIRDYSGDDEFSEYNLRNHATLTLVKSDTWKPFVQLDMYDDLNEEEYYDYYTAGAGLQALHYLGRPHVLRQQLLIGTSDRYDDIPLMQDYTARLSTKLHPDWMLVQKLQLQSWYDTENSELLLGNSFVESIAQRTIALDNNRISRVRAAVKHSFYNEETILKANLQYHLWQLVFFGEYKYYVGDFTVNDQAMIGQVSGLLLGDTLRISYELQNYLRSSAADRLVHGVSIAWRY
jgi:hypothetical protein